MIVKRKSNYLKVRIKLKIKEEKKYEQEKVKK